MAANEETVSIDTVKKTLWDSLESLGENISGETLTALMEIIERGGAAAPFIVNGTDEIVGETITITLDCNAESLYAAAIAGKTVRIIVGDDTDSVLPLAAVKSIASGKYSFGFLNEGGLMFSCEEIAGTDSVVLTASSG